ncbi:MAG: hypothetical protein AB1758_07040 [Candidatus Eremiobacterota bacterium]
MMVRSLQPTGYLLSAAGTRSGGVQPGLARAAASLMEQGWTFEFLQQYDYSHRQEVDADGAARFFARERRGDRSSGDRLVATPPSGRPLNLIRPDELQTLAMFQGARDPLARRIDELRADGILLQPSPGCDVPDPHGLGAHLSMSRGAGAVVRLQRVELTRVHGDAPRDIDRALEPYSGLLDYYRSTLLGLARAGKLQEFMLGEVRSVGR